MTRIPPPPSWDAGPVFRTLAHDLRNLAATETPSRDDLRDLALLADGSRLALEPVTEETQRTTVSLHQFLEDRLDLFQRTPAGRDVSLELHLEDAEGGLMVTARAELSVDLLVRATARLARAPRLLKLEVVTEPHHAALRLSTRADTTLLSHLMEDLERERPGAMGLRMQLARHLAQCEGGVLTVCGDTAARRLTLELKLPMQPAVPLAPPSRSSPNVSGEVLVVDDNADAAETLAIALDLNGYVVQRASDGVEALQLAADLRIGTILLDLGLPALDGYEVARRLRQREAQRALLIIAVSGYGDDEALIKSQAAGIDHHLVKPVDLNHLLDVLPPPGTHGP